MVDNDYRWERHKKIPLLCKICRLKINHDVPAEGSNLVNQAAVKCIRPGIDETPYIVEPHAAHARGVHRGKLIFAYVRPDGRNPAGTPSRMRNRIEHRPIILAMARRLHKDAARKPHAVPKCKKLIAPRVTRRVFARG